MFDRSVKRRVAEAANGRFARDAFVRLWMSIVGTEKIVGRYIGQKILEASAFSVQQLVEGRPHFAFITLPAAVGRIKFSCFRIMLLFFFSRDEWRTFEEDAPRFVAPSGTCEPHPTLGFD